MSSTVTGFRPLKAERRGLGLTVTSGPDRGLSKTIAERMRVGTSALADLVLKDPKVSGLHCELTWPRDELVLRDLGSKNGTFVDRLRVVEVMLQPGNAIRMGDTELAVTALDHSIEVPLHPDDHFFGIFGGSDAIRSLTARLARVAGTDSTVLVQGETGTGKERVAQALHAASARKEGPFVVIDCGALSPQLIEDALFGHELGAFTGATSAATGAFEQANGGTLFLDEIGELNLDLQPKLLRAIETRSVKRLGGAAQKATDVRIIAATNRDLAVEVERGRFREDLYYRLAVVTLVVPPLRDRLEDIPLIARALLKELGADPSSVLTVKSLSAMLDHDWPGNVRELRNTLERSMALKEPLEIRAQKSAASAEPMADVDLSVPMREGKQRLIERYERAYLLGLFEACEGNVSEVARRAGLDRMSVYRALERLGLDTPRRGKR